MRNLDDMRDQAVRVALGIPAATVAKMARVNRGTLIRYEISPTAVTDEGRRERCAQVYRELRALLARHPLAKDEVSA
jgi:hypothetical protein